MVQAPFEIHDDNETLKRMRMQYVAKLSDISTMVPEKVVQFTTTWQVRPSNPSFMNHFVYKRNGSGAGANLQRS